MDRVASPHHAIYAAIHATFPSMPILPIHMSKPVPGGEVFSLVRRMGHVAISGQLKQRRIIMPGVLGLNISLVTADGVLGSRGGRPWGEGEKGSLVRRSLILAFSINARDTEYLLIGRDKSFRSGRRRGCGIPCLSGRPK